MHSLWGWVNERGDCGGAGDGGGILSVAVALSLLILMRVASTGVGVVIVDNTETAQSLYCQSYSLLISCCFPLFSYAYWLIMA